MGFVEEFMSRYVKEYDFYTQAGQLVSNSLETNLRAAGVRCIVTHRAKSISRLEEKCRKRNRKDPYLSVDSIFADIVDLAGVRVALYFPAEREQVDKLISRTFNLLEPKKTFPDASKSLEGKRFSGYSAVHYRVQLKEQDLNDSDKRYASARVEIQVASVLMHAWAEVEHDLVYKPLDVDLSDDERAILDQLNGLVMAGEISLERLQKAGESRVSNSENRFNNHYDLAIHLLGRVDNSSDQPITDAGLGRVDLLLRFLTKLEKDTPSLLAPYLEALHGNLELRPLAEQVTDALIAEDDSRYEIYHSIRGDVSGLRAEEDLEDQDYYAHIGRFLRQWAILESVMRGKLTTGQTTIRSRQPISRELEQRGFISAETRMEIDSLRRMRNEIVHGVDNWIPIEIANAMRRIDVIIDDLHRETSDE